jgi:energy-coupling factor transporter transmembrane protein EcfT
LVIDTGQWIRYPLHPLASIVLSLLTLTLGLMLRQPANTYLFVAILAVLYLVAGYGRPLWRVFRVLLPIGLVVAGLARLAGDSSAGSLMTLGRIALVGLSSVLLISVHPTRLSRALTQAGCPRIVALALLITIRFVPVLQAEMKRIREAMTVRGVTFQWTNLRHAYRALFLPLVVRLVNISDLLALSVETRAFSLGERGTVYKPVTWQRKDALVGIAFAGAIATALAL